jgi:hypothetical protein
MSSAIPLVNWRTDESPEVTLVTDSLRSSDFHPLGGFSEKDGGRVSVLRSKFLENLTLSVDLCDRDAKLTAEYSRNVVVPVAMTK